MLKSLQKYFSPRQPGSFLETDHLENNLKERSVRGGAITVISQIIKFGSQTGGTLILARLLTPEDFGLIGMVTVVLNFIDLFKDLGLSTATLQRSKINQSQVSILFWINILVSIITAFITIALAPVIASFYGEPRLTQIVIAFASIFILGGLTVQHQALLKRQMCFGSLAKIEVASMLVGITIAITSANAGAGYWSIVIWRLAQSLVNTLGVWFFCGWRPGPPRWDSSVASMLAFGGSITGFNIINYFSRNLDNILIGRYWGAKELGFYSLSYRLLLFPIEQINTPITNVALPALSRLQGNTERYCRYYYQAILMITTIGMPIVGFFFVNTYDIILLALGEQWIGATPIFKFLAPAAFVGTFNVAMGWAFISLGRADRQLRWGIISSILNVLIFIVSVQWGVVELAAAYGLSRPLFVAVGILYCYHQTPLKPMKLATTIAKPFFASVAAMLSVSMMNYFLLVDFNPVPRLLISLLLYSATYIGAWLIRKDSRAEFIEILVSLKSLKS